MEASWGADEGVMGLFVVVGRLFEIQWESFRFIPSTNWKTMTGYKMNRVSRISGPEQWRSGSEIKRFLYCFCEFSLYTFC